MRHVRIKSHERGYEDDLLDTLDGLPLVIAEWSRPEPITEDAVNELSDLDIMRAWATAKGVNVPNLLSPSSVGTEPKGTAVKVSRRRSNG